MENRFQFRVWKGKESRMVYSVTYLNPLILDPEIDPENFDEKYLSFLLTNIKTKESMVFYPNIKLEVIGNIYQDKEMLQ